VAKLVSMASVNLNQGGGCKMIDIIDQSHDRRGFNNERLKLVVYPTYFNKIRECYTLSILY
jgi:hypothetical protein